MTTKKKPGEWARDVAELAGILRVDGTTVRRWTRRHDWLWPKAGPYFVDGIRRWRDAFLRSADPDTDELKKQKLAAEVAIKRQQLAVMQSKYIDRAEYEAALVAYTAFVRSKLEELCDSVPALFADSGQARAILTDRYDRFCGEMATSVGRVPRCSGG